MNTVLILLVSACGGGHVALPDLTPISTGDTSGLVARGEYIVRSVAVCGHCHAADPQKDPDGPLTGGFAFRNWRLGTIRASNLTPDSATGLGAWSDAEVVRAIRNGEDRRGNLEAPIMPYEWFHDMSDRDAQAVVRYLRSLKPVSNEIRSQPNFVYKMAKVFLLKPEKNGQPRNAPARKATAEYGDYLANHVSLCADCHTPRKGLQSTPDRHSLYAGDSNPPNGFPANPSNLTPDTLSGIGKWSEEDFLRTMHTGINPQGDTLHPFMTWHQLKRMTDDDLRAVFHYLRSLPAIRNRVPRR